MPLRTVSLNNLDAVCHELVTAHRAERSGIERTYLICRVTFQPTGMNRDTPVAHGLLKREDHGLTAPWIDVFEDIPARVGRGTDLLAEQHAVGVGEDGTDGTVRLDGLCEQSRNRGPQSGRAVRQPKDSGHAAAEVARQVGCADERFIRIVDQERESK